jgi:hypothetical protein
VKFAVVGQVTAGDVQLDVVTATGCEGCYFEQRVNCDIAQTCCADPQYREHSGIVVFIPAGTLDQFVANRVTRKLTGETS